MKLLLTLSALLAIACATAISEYKDADGNPLIDEHADFTIIPSATLITPFSTISKHTTTKTHSNKPTHARRATYSHNPDPEAVKTAAFCYCL